MGQIFNRMLRVAKSYLNDVDSFGIRIDKDDQDLKKIIDDLHAEKSGKRENQSKEQKESKSNTSNRQAEQEQKMGFEMAFNILKISHSASVEEIKAAYKDRVKEYHPDRVASMGPELREIAEQKTQLINEAYAFLRKNKGF